ncbi:MAG: hypothetical protein ACREK3_06520 [Gemmatimonadota bacterium]
MPNRKWHTPSWSAGSLGSAALVAIVACSGSNPPTSDGQPPGNGLRQGNAVVHDGIEYRADVAVMESFPVQLAGNVGITNLSGEARTVTFPAGCVALLRAYRPGGADPVWDQALEVVCTMALVPMELPPGATHEVRTPTVRAHEILDEELPDGEYRITVYLRPNGGVVEIDAGTTDLAIPR